MGEMTLTAEGGLRCRKTPAYRGKGTTAPQTSCNQAKHWLPQCSHPNSVCPTSTSYLPGEDVAVPAELQRVTILLLPWVTPYELEVHLFPIQLSLVR